MEQRAREEALRRLASAEGHLAGIKKMIEADQYCVDVLRQINAVERALQKVDSIILRGHLNSCVPERISGPERDQVATELAELYELARR